MGGCVWGKDVNLIIKSTNLPVQYRYMYRVLYTEKSYRGEPGHTHGTHGTHGRTRAHGSHVDEHLTTIQTHNDAPARPRDGRNRDQLNSRKYSRRPRVDRSPRPTQKRPPPANPTLVQFPAGVFFATGESGKRNRYWYCVPVVYR